MTPEAQRIAIAKACPNLFWIYCSPLTAQTRVFRIGEHPAEGDKACDLLNDLNAMHEAVACQKAKNPAFMVGYLLHLQVTSGDKSFPGMSVGTLVESTATQRAEAFLRTLNLWKD